MAGSNIFAETQELIQQIETNYQKGVDYKRITGDDLYKLGMGIISILSPRLKKYCREKFIFPLGVNDYLDYWKNDTSGSAVLYQVNQTIKSGEEKGDILWWCKEKFDAQKLDKNPKKCSVCGQKTFKKDGRMKLWDDECRDIGVNEDGYSRKVSRPLPLAYLHPECAKKYFADKEQPNENFSQIKEKLLRNLDKISFDQAGHLANAELLKLPYEYGTQKKEKAGVYRIKIDNGEINLRDLDRLENREYYLEIRNAIVKNIKQNIQDWEVKSDEYNDDYLENQKNGVKVWLIIFNNELVFENGKKDWAEIEKLLKDYNYSVTNDKKAVATNNFELEWLKNLFQELKIKKIVFENGKLTIEFINHQTTSFENNDNREYRILKRYCQKNNQKVITRESLNLGGGNNTSAGSDQNKNNQQLAIGLALGAGAVILAGIIYLLVSRKRKINK